MGAPHHTKGTTMSDTLTAHPSTTIILNRNQYSYRSPERIVLTGSGVAAIPARRRRDVEADVRRVPYEPEMLESWYPLYDGRGKYRGEASHHTFEVCVVTARRAQWVVWCETFVVYPHDAVGSYDQIAMENRLVRYVAIKVPAGSVA